MGSSYLYERRRSLYNYDYDIRTVLILGVIAGGIIFITNYFGMKNSGDRIDSISRGY
jgi:hypothetical protein